MRCDKTWVPRIDDVRQCPRCKSASWNKIKGEKIYDATSASLRQRKWQLHNPEKTECHQKFKYALKKGILIRANTCSACGINCKPNGHHPDYSKPLEVIWLCVGCHKKEHKRIKVLNQAVDKRSEP